MKRLDLTLIMTTVLLTLGTATRGDFVIDGSNNYAPANTYATSSTGYTGYVAANTTHLHFAINGPDVQSNSLQNWWVAYIGGNGTNTTTGVLFNTQQPVLSFNATHFFQWRPSDNSALLLSWNGTSWVNTGVNVSRQRSGQFVEAAIPLSNLGSPTSVQFASYLLREQPFNELSYAATPSTAFVDQYDPDLRSSLTVSAVPEPSASMALGLIGMLLVGGHSRRRVVKREHE